MHYRKPIELPRNAEGKYRHAQNHNLCISVPSGQKYGRPFFLPASRARYSSDLFQGYRVLSIPRRVKCCTNRTWITVDFIYRIEYLRGSPNDSTGSGDLLAMNNVHRGKIGAHLGMLAAVCFAFCSHPPLLPSSFVSIIRLLLMT